ncbi:putative protein tyrosine phosphatase [Tieghemostelium lacteum]|uniref:Tyrosine specific protein phosphatases domain-containing protein n=1 Tax=Tieghemostelium lacteum TaxID=361077 RepID=A0A152A4T6_TIELA|nr:putative protein tyrosine phosphatase [Tieghemostelium lacteum]|eukprot:KYR01243.1 putative protein tyrosine phosphatase [Tieghemostelium lacteum]
MLKIYVLLVLSILLCSSLVISSDIEQRKVHLVDMSTNPLPNGNTNYLFRGNEPKIGGENGTTVFAYSELVDYLQNASSQVGVTLPENFYIFDIKLITGPLPSEIPDIELEANFFAANPELGEFATNQTVGDIIDPNFLSQTEIAKMVKSIYTWQKDDLPERMRMIHNMLNYYENDLPVVIYIHCECGCDRTGEIFASYVMRFKGQSFQEAMDWDYQIAGRPIEWPSQWASLWYCWYLYYIEDMAIDCSFVKP